MAPSKISTPTQTSKPPSLKKSTSGSQSSMNQQSIASFFQKRAIEGQPAKPDLPRKIANIGKSANGVKESLSTKPAIRSSSSLTPAPSSDAIREEDIRNEASEETNTGDFANGLPSPITPANGSSQNFNSPSRKVR